MTTRPTPPYMGVGGGGGGKERWLTGSLPFHIHTPTGLTPHTNVFLWWVAGQDIGYRMDISPLLHILL